MQKLLIFMIALMAVIVIGCTGTTTDTEEPASEDAATEESASDETASEEDLDPIDAAILSGDPAECEKLGSPALVEGCKREQANEPGN